MEKILKWILVSLELGMGKKAAKESKTVTKIILIEVEIEINLVTKDFIGMMIEGIKVEIILLFLEIDQEIGKGKKEIILIKEEIEMKEMEIMIDLTEIIAMKETISRMIGETLMIGDLRILKEGKEKMILIEEEEGTIAFEEIEVIEEGIIREVEVEEVSMEDNNLADALNVDSLDISQNNVHNSNNLLEEIGIEEDSEEGAEEIAKHQMIEFNHEVTAKKTKTIFQIPLKPQNKSNSID